MDVTIGARLGPYDILEPLGHGGMGEVWKARDTRLNRFVAVKRVLGGQGERFEREARAVAALNHPHICQIYDVGPGYLVLEYVDGVTLAQWLEASRQEMAATVENTVRFAIQMAGALEEAHRHHILHRDLKPANIMVVVRARTELPSVKILDFGLAKLVRDDPGAARTADGAIVGTAAYMSPEQAEGRLLDERSDIFSLGAVLFEMLSGRRAFNGVSTVDILNAVIRVDVPPLQRWPALDRIVRRCLEKSPALRFQSAGDLKAALEDAQRSLAPNQLDPERSVAVLPFANMSADKENEYFGDGLAEEIITALAQIPGLKVTARTSAFAFRGKEQDITRIAEALRVRTVLEGSVRRSGNRVRVTAQLVNAADGYRLWSDRYDREMTEAFAIQDDIAESIARSLHEKLTLDAAPRRHLPNALAYEAFLKARYYMGQLIPEALSRTRVLLDQAIALDPEFAPARQHLSHYYLLQALWGGKPAHDAMPLARRSALEALACDPALLDAHAVLGVVAGLYDYDWVEQERQFRLALAREPVSSDVYAHYGMHGLLLTGRPVEAAKALRRALDNDPLNLVFRVQRALCLDAAGEIDEAEAELLQVLELNENCGPAAEWLALTRAFRGRHHEAASYAERAFVMAGQRTRFAGLLAGILQQIGETDRASRLVSGLGDGDSYGAPVELMLFNLLQSRLDDAAAWAEKAIAERDGYLPVLVSTLVGPALRSTPQWPRLARLMNLPDAP